MAFSLIPSSFILIRAIIARVEQPDKSGCSSQKMRESDHLLVIERERAKERQGTRNDIVATLPQCDQAKSRDIVADKVGMSGRTFDKARTIWEKAKEGDGLTEHH